jgi:hypothetical protein
MMPSTSFKTRRLAVTPREMAAMREEEPPDDE